MEEKILKAMEHLRILSSVSQGMLTLEDLNAVIGRYQLDLDQQLDLSELLRQEGIVPVSPEERAARLSEPDPGPVTPDETSIHEANEALWKLRLPALLEALDREDAFARQMEEEIPLLCDAIADYSVHYGPPPHSWCAARIVSHAIMDISGFRIRERRKNGWVCGTHTGNLRRALQRQLSNQFPEAELTALVACCSSDTSALESGPLRETLLLLLDMAPEIMVHPRISVIKAIYNSETTPT